MKASFLLRLSPVILLEPGLGLEGECTLAGVVGSLWARLTLQSLGALSPLPWGHSLRLPTGLGRRGCLELWGAFTLVLLPTQLEPGTPRFLPL